MAKGAVEVAAKSSTGARPLVADAIYVLTARLQALDVPDCDRVLGPFESHEHGEVARCSWAIDRQSVIERAEVLTGARLEADYLGRYGRVMQHGGESRG